MSNPLNQPLKFTTHLYDLDGNLRTDVDATVEVFDPAGNSIATGDAVVLGTSYTYELDDALVTTYGTYVCVFTFVDDGNVVPITDAVPLTVTEWATRIDATVGSRLPSSSYTAPPSAASIRGEIDANSTKLDVAVGTRLAASGYTTPPTAAQVRAEIDTNSVKLDVAVGTRLASAAYTEPPDAAALESAVVAGMDTQGYTAARAAFLDTDVPDVTEIKTAVRTGLTEQGYTTARAGYLDALNGLIANLWAYAARTLTDYGLDEVLTSLNTIEGVVEVMNSRMTTGELVVTAPLIVGKQEITVIQGDDYRTADGRQLEWQFAEGQAPDLTGGTTTLKVVNLRTSTVILTKAGTIPAARSVRFELTSTETAALTADAYAFEVSATLANTHIVTLIPLHLGKFYVKAQA